MSRRSSILLTMVLLLTIISCSPKQPRINAEPEPQPLTDLFSLTLEDLTAFTAGLQNRNTAEQILAEPAEFLRLMEQVLEEPEELLLLADKQNALPDDYAPEDLRSLTEYPLLLNRNDLRLRRIIMPDLLAMDQAARNAGIKLVYSSSYRSYEYQKNLFARYVREMGEAEASRVSARPGTSQHQLGTTVDFGSITDEFAGTPAGKWLYTHAPEYGFSLSYPKGFEEITGYTWECWHYRYIGKGAAEMTQKYFDGIQHYFLYFMHDNRSFFESRRRQ